MGLWVVRPVLKMDAEGFPTALVSIHRAAYKYKQFTLRTHSETILVHLQPTVQHLRRLTEKGYTL